MHFRDIPGQEEIKGRLIRSVQESRVSHAQLFSGPEGCGSLALALAYAMYVSCENRTEADSCGTCKSCVKYSKMIHPDLHFVFPVFKGKAAEAVSDNYISEWREFAVKSPYFTFNSWMDYIEVGNAQGLIAASEAAEIIRKLSLKTFEADFKIMIIWLPEKMHPSAANKLLKMIEEPPERTLFLLVSDEPDKIIPTILSRCQIVKIPPFTREAIEKHIAVKYGLERERAADIASISGGNIAKAEALCGNENIFSADLERFKNLMRFAWKRDVISLSGWAEEIATTGREAQKNFLTYSLRLLRENLMLSLGQPSGAIVRLTGEESEFSGKFHPFITPENINQLYTEFNLCHAHIEANGNARIVFLDMALKVAKLIR